MVPRTTQATNARTRRGVFKAVGVALATGVTTSTTGCLSSLPPLGQKQTYDRVDVPPPDESTYQSWLPAPATLDNGHTHPAVTYTEPSPIDGDEPEEFIGRRAPVIVRRIATRFPSTNRSSNATSNPGNASWIRVSYSFKAACPCTSANGGTEAISTITGSSSTWRTRIGSDIPVCLICYRGGTD